jgi:hypothetical protein
MSDTRLAPMVLLAGRQGRITYKEALYVSNAVSGLLALLQVGLDTEEESRQLPRRNVMRIVEPDRR